MESWNKDAVLDNTEQNEDEIDSESEKEADCIFFSTTEQSISTDQALISLNEVIQWTEENQLEIDYSTSLALLNLRQKILNAKLLKKQRQLHITSFFVPQ